MKSAKLLIYPCWFSVNLCKLWSSSAFPVVQENSQQQKNDQIKILHLWGSLFSALPYRVTLYHCRRHRSLRCLQLNPPKVWRSSEERSCPTAENVPASRFTTWQGHYRSPNPFWLKEALLSVALNGPASSVLTSVTTPPKGVITLSAREDRARTQLQV